MTKKEFISLHLGRIEANKKSGSEEPTFIPEKPKSGFVVIMNQKTRVEKGLDDMFDAFEKEPDMKGKIVSIATDEYIVPCVVFDSENDALMFTFVNPDVFAIYSVKHGKYASRADILGS